MFIYGQQCFCAPVVLHKYLVDYKNTVYWTPICLKKLCNVQYKRHVLTARFSIQQFTIINSVHWWYVGMNWSWWGAGIHTWWIKNWNCEYSFPLCQRYCILPHFIISFSLHILVPSPLPQSIDINRIGFWKINHFEIFSSNSYQRN